jgi:hypothetical protein
MGAFIDLTNQKFNKLKAIYPIRDSSTSNVKWFCMCDCGNTHIVRQNHLKHSRIKSCGCLKAIVARTRPGFHGYTGTSTYHIWLAMRSRCLTKTSPAYKDYGARGITICKKWNKFENFLKDMGERPAGLSLERKDNNKGYSKENCKWATRLEQAQNTRGVKLTLEKAVEILRMRKGPNKIKIKDICERFGISACTVHSVVNGESWPQAQDLVKL